MKRRLMEKMVFFIIISLCFITQGTAQQWAGSQNSTGPIYRTGPVGINNSTPGEMLDIGGRLRLGDALGTPQAGKIFGAAEMEEDMSLIGNGFGAYGPAIRSGGIAGWLLNGKGTTVGNNLNMPRKSSGALIVKTYLHELAHYYQQIQGGFGEFMGRGLYEQINSTLESWGWGGYDPYITPGNMEWAAEQLSIIYFR